MKSSRRSARRDGRGLSRHRVALRARARAVSRIEPEQWWLFQLRVKDATCLVRINGDTVLEYDRLEVPAAGPIALQAHSAGRWTQYKLIHVRPI